MDHHIIYLSSFCARMIHFWLQDIFELIVREDLIQRKAVLEGVNSMLEAVADAVMDAPFVPTMVSHPHYAIATQIKTSNMVPGVRASA